jgi:photosystem II stability/assembly factor-like uncharacterized protein
LITALAVDRSSTVYAAAYGAGVFKGANGGASWSPIHSGLTYPTVTVLAVDPVDQYTLYAGTGLTHLGVTERVGIFRSGDGGANWVPANAGLPNTAVAAIAIDPRNPSTLYVGTSAYEATSEETWRDSGLFRSTDRGESWTVITPPRLCGRGAYFRGVALDPRNPSKLYAAFSLGIFKSVDAGATWDQVLAGEFVQGIALDPGNPDTLYAWANTEDDFWWGTVGIHRSTNGGAEWTQVSSFPTDGPFTLAVDPGNSSTLYARADGLFKSTDGGATWNRIGSGLPNSGVGLPVADPAGGSTVYIGTRRGVFKSVDAGVSWQPAASN